MSDNVRNTLLISRIGAKNTEQHNAAISKANKGVPKSEKAKEMMSKAKLGTKASDKTKAKLSNPNV